MTNLISRRGILAGAVVSVVGLKIQACPEVTTTDKLELKSAYNGKILISGARRVSLSMTFDKKGNGWGTLTLDPNITDGMRSTTIAIRTIQVKADILHDEEHAAKGRRLYELQELPLEGRIAFGFERWFLVRPSKKGMPCSLIFADMEGKFEDMLMLE